MFRPEDDEEHMERCDCSTNGYCLEETGELPKNQRCGAQAPYLNSINQKLELQKLPHSSKNAPAATIENYLMKNQEAIFAKLIEIQNLLKYNHMIKNY